MKKFAYASGIGICAGFLASMVVFFKGLDTLEVLSYFVFWVGLGFMVAYTHIRMGWWLRGLILAEIFAIPVFLMTLKSFGGESLAYMTANIVLINGFIGITMGYFNGLASDEVNEIVVFSQDYAKKLKISAAAGFLTSLIVLVPMSFYGQSSAAKISAVLHWTVLSLIISSVNINLKGWLVGFIVVELTMIPMAIVYIRQDPLALWPMLIIAGAIGAFLGMFNYRYAKAVIVGSVKSV